jgi:RNA polymerase sigma-B factor
MATTVALQTLTPDQQRLGEERALFERLADGGAPIDRDAIVERFLPLARKLARRYARSDEPFDDVYQVACMGLIKAIDRFDVSRGRAFSSFAVPTIAGEIKRYYRDKTWAVHVPRDLQDLALAVDRTVRELESGLGRKPTLEELADELGRTQEELLEAMHAAPAYRAASLDAPHGDGEDASAPLGATVAIRDHGLTEAEDRVAVSALTRTLTRRERFIVSLRFQHDLTQAQIGELVGLSQMQISRILRTSLVKLRDAAAIEPPVTTMR